MSQSTLGWITRVLILGLILCIISCKRGPETQDPFLLEIRPGMVESLEDIRWAEHEVIVQEVLTSTNNLYLKVEEGSKTYWLATGLGSIKPGKKYFFNEAVIKRDFRSEELDREFDSIYLVSQLLPESRKEELKRMGFNPHQADSSEAHGKSEGEARGKEKVSKVSLEELLANPKRYQNQVVEVSGTCTKINEGIMERNWIHLKSDPADAQEIVATSGSTVGVGETITLRAIVRLDKDFGAGYTYPILLEEAILIE